MHHVYPHLRFPELESESLSHAFSLRNDEWPEYLANNTKEVLKACAMPLLPIYEVKQVHGNRVLVVEDQKPEETLREEADALITDRPGLLLSIRTADCGPVFFYDVKKRAVGLAHSGKKGTALEISREVILAMGARFGSSPADIVTVLGPCIRPPHYEIDFAAEIARQCRAAGVEHYYDCKENTGADLARFYSYRVEKGKTGRHYSGICSGPF